MYITHSFVGTTIGRFRYLFFALYEDYNDFGRAFVREFNISLERLGRELRDKGAVIRPFEGDIEQTRKDVLEGKDWTPEEKEEVKRVPSLLVINKDFDDFSPREDPWIVFHFGPRRFGGDAGIAEIDEIMRAIVDVATDPNTDANDLLEVARDMSLRPDLARIFEIKPGIFGCSIDVLAAGSQVRERLRERLRPIGRTARATTEG